MKLADMDKEINKLDEAALLAMPLDFREAEKAITAAQAKKKADQNRSSAKAKKRTSFHM